MTNEQNQEKQKYPLPMSIITHVFWTGLFGGVFWSIIGYLAHLFHFTTLHPNVILEPWALGRWKKEWQGTLISIILIGIISIGIAYIYYAAFKQFKGMAAGIIYGLALFLIVFFVLNPLFPSISPIYDLSRDTIITSICLYIIYGLFIGYSISYQYQSHHIGDKGTAT